LPFHHANHKDATMSNAAKNRTSTHSIDTQVWTAIDYEKPGKQLGFLGVPQSTNTAGWATQYVPIAVIKGSSGPTALLFGGNHGDEYEGPVSLPKLARTIDPDDVQGRIIILPMLNPPAVQAGTRLSPVDGKNMNRSYPGERDGTLTSMIAHYVTHALLPLADLVVDIHSGGRSAHVVPSVNMHQLTNVGQMQQMIDAGIAWGAPYVFIYRDVAGEGLLPTLSERMGKVTLGTELGSASQFTPAILRITEEGLYNVLRHRGILAGEVTPPAQPPQVVGATEREDYIMAPVSGIFEPFFDLCEWVERGQAVGQIHSVEQPFQEPMPVIAEIDGMVMARRAFPLTRQGDCVITLVRPFSL
jgi:N-alpha-acetyl-L-2,4-diaminobutyrate deacetylase